MVEITDCQRLHVAGVTFKNSPLFHLVPINVTDLLIEKAKFSAPAKAPNTDAIDPYDCENVVIRDCDFDVGDDDISIKNGGQHILIENCRVKHGHGISIGSLTTNGISDVLVRNCSFDGADNGVRIKSMRGSGGLVHDIHYTDITMKNMRDAIVLDMTYSTSGGKAPVAGETTKIPVVRDVVIDNITIDSAKVAGKIVGIEESPFSNIVIRNVTLRAAKDFVMTNEKGVVLENVTKEIGDANIGSHP
jgi:polygalacturonase